MDERLGLKDGMELTVGLDERLGLKDGTKLSVGLGLKDGSSVGGHMSLMSQLSTPPNSALQHSSAVSCN